MASNFFNKASLVMVPDAPIDGIQPSVKPEDRSGDFTFTRGSNLAATRVNKSQLIEKGRENLLLQSNQFDTTWTTGATLTSGQSGYNGNNAWKFASSSGGQTGMQQSVSFSNIHTFSVYAKAGSVDFIKLFVVQSGTNRTCVIDLSDGSIASDNSVSASSPEASVTSLANGWYRIEMPTNANSATFVRIRPHLTASDDNLSVGDFIYIQDSQVENSLVATPYIETGATTAQAGILENTPRLDYSGGATCPSLLLEPSRTNSFATSEGYYNWSNTGATITVNQGLSPEGVNNAALFEATSTSQPRIENNVANVSSVYSTSIFVKKVVGDYFGIGWYQGDVGNSFAKFNIAEGTFDGYSGDELTSADIVSYGNGWYRISVKLSTTSSTSKSGVKFVAMSSASAGAGNIGDQFLLYGAQLELGSYATSYIPTYGTSQTRAQDVCGDAGDVNTFNSTEGVLYAEIAALADDEINRHITLWDGTDTNRLVLKYDNQSNVVQVFNRVDGVETAFLGHSLADITISHKIAVRYKANDYALVIDGVEVDTDTSSSTWSASVLNNVKFSNGSGSDFYGKTKQLIYFPIALSDDECIALTTI